MNEKEMIEEMARDIAFIFCPNRGQHKKWGNKAQCYSDNNFSECTTIKNAVDKLYNQGYRKIPDGSVVLDRERKLEQKLKDLEAENEKLKNYNDKLSQGIYFGNGEQFCNRLEQARKETAKEILKDAENELHNIAIEYANAGHMTYFAVCENIYHKVIRPLAKRYGVEE